MDNNNYNNYNENSTTDNNMNAADNTNAGNTTAADNSSQPENSSTYGYSYVNQEQKNPYTVWRADENTANGYTNSSANNTYGNAQYDNNAYTNAQYDANSAYGNQTQTGGSCNSSYGNTNTQGNWNTYSDAQDKKKEERAKKRAEKAAQGNSNFGMKLAKCASFALIFGLVAGTAFEGSSYVVGTALGTNEKEVVSTVDEAKEKNVLNTPDNTKKTVIATSRGPSVDVSDIVEECEPSIVAITNLSQVQVQNFFGQIKNYEIPSAGSGVIISEDDDYLYIVTNNHVVESATTLTIQFCDETTASAEVKGTDRSSDLAVVKVSKADIEKETLSSIKVATLGDSDNVKVGSQAIAIGNALGYGQSVTGGWVSALNREVTIEDEKTGESFTNELLQTDAAINPGNSGGALLSSEGEVIGINSSKYSDIDVEGIGFAIPANVAKPIIEDLITKEVVSDDKAAYLGLIGAADVTSSIASTYNIPEGVCITEIARGSAAEQYGLKKGDIITKFDGRSVKSKKALQNMLTYYEAGTEVDIVVQRPAEGGYQEQTVTVVLGKKNA